MGCICSKGIRADVDENNSKRKGTVRSSKRLDKDVGGLDDNGNDATSRLISNHPGVDTQGPTPVVSDDEERRIVSPFPDHRVRSRVVAMVNGERGAQVVAGWPSWLTAVAGEAINGWVPRGADSFEKLDKIGQGTYSSVYRARDLETNKIVALKKVRFANMDPESVRFMAREIIILRKLDHPNVMKLEGINISRVSGSLYLVFEYMEHDLAGLLASPGVKFTEAQIKCYVQQLLKGLAYCHSRGVLHRDIKGSNLLIDYRGILKIGDFGLATFFNQQKQQPLTSRVVTLWYRPPELLLGATDYGVSVDLWSTGCILAELFAGKPIMPGRTEVEQLHKIFKLCGSPSEEYWKTSKLPHATIFKPQQPYKRCVSETFKDLPSSALALLDILLAVEPQYRGTASSALESDFFTTKPLPCDPSSLPKYPPSKEFDAKLRNEEARRRKAADGKELQNEPAKRNPKGSKLVAAPDANAELQASIQKRRWQGNLISASKKFNREGDGGSGFPIEPRNGFSHSGQSMNPNNDEAFRDTSSFLESSTKSTNFKTQRSYINREAAQLSRFSSSVAVRGSSQLDCSSASSSINEHWPGDRFGARYNNPDDSSHHLLRPNLPSKEDQPPGLDRKAGLFAKKGRMHYSGPLMPSGGNIEEMLKEHERQIQEAVRKARTGKSKADQNRQTESLLYGLR